MKNQKRINDKGFSILEAMVAIVILSIIFIPVTNSFISSIKASNETKIMHEATLTAQQVMEDFKQKTFQELAAVYSQNDAAKNALLTQMNSNTWSSLAFLKTIKREDNGCCDFDVEVTLSKDSTCSETSGMTQINQVSMKKIYSMDALSSYTLNLGAVPDDALESIGKNAHCTKNMVKSGVTRKITMKLTSNATTGNTKISGDVVYHFGSNTYQGEPFCTELNAKVKNIYLYYIAEHNGERDTFTFVNDEGLEGNLHVIGESADATITNYVILLDNCTNLNKFHVATTVNMTGPYEAYTVSPEAEFAPNSEIKVRRYELDVKIKRKKNGKVYSHMVSTRGE